MKTSTHPNKQRGITLVMALLFLLILTVISVFAATSSSLELKMAGNMQDSFASFQASEAGTSSTLALSGNANADPFDGKSTDIADGNVLSTGSDIKCDEDGTPQDTDGMDVFFRTWEDDNIYHPLRAVFGGASTMSVCKTLTAALLECPRSVDGFSLNMIKCDNYDIRSRHMEARKAHTKVHLGVIKTVINQNAQF